MWQPAKQFHANTPTRVYFVGYEGEIPNTVNQQATWNILRISDSNGPEGKGAWYFGTNGEDYLLQSTKQFLTEMILCGLINRNELFFSGKGMGGHAAIYMAVEFDAKGCIAHNPTTNLSDSTYVKRKHKTLFEQIFPSTTSNDYCNLQSMLSENSAKISITHNLDSGQTFFQEHISPLSNHVEDIRFQTKYDFEEMFAHFSDQLSPNEEFHIEQYNFDESFDATQRTDISVKLSSREEVSFRTDFSFTLDPFKDRSWRFWFQNLSWLPKHLDTIGHKIAEKQADYVASKWIAFMQNKESEP